MNRFRKIEDFINQNFSQLNEFEGIPPKEPPTQNGTEDEWDINPIHLQRLVELARANGLELDEDLLGMAAIALTELDNLTETKIKKLLWQYFICVLFNTWTNLPPQRRFGVVMTAFLLGIAVERTLDWEFEDNTSGGTH